MHRELYALDSSPEIYKVTLEEAKSARNVEFHLKTCYLSGCLDIFQNHLEVFLVQSYTGFRSVTHSLKINEYKNKHYTFPQVF